MNPQSPAHQAFRHPIFQSNDFQLYKQEMAVHLNTFQAPELTSLQHDHPGISARFDALQNQLGNHESMLTTLQNGMSQLPLTITNDMIHVLATGATNFASSLLNPQDASPQQQELLPNSHSDEESPATGPRRLTMPPGTPAALCVQGAEMNPSPQSATEIYQQYHGIGTFAGQPIDGGFAKLEKEGGNWKATYTNVQRQRFSKWKRIVKAIDDRIKGGESAESSLEFFDVIWSSNDVNKNETKMINKLQKDGLLQVNSRKRKAHEEMARQQRHLQHQVASGGAPLCPGPPAPPLLNQMPYMQALPPPINPLNPTHVV